MLKLLAQKPVLSSLCGGESQRHAVVAVALSGWPRAVAKDVALMATAAAAVVFSPGDDQFEVHLGLDGIREGLPEAGPAGAAVVLRLEAEQR